MGNNTEYRLKERYLSLEEIKLINDNEPNLNEIMNKYKNSDGILTVKELRILSKGLLTSSLCKKIIKICGVNDRLTVDDFLYFYALLNTDSFKAKLNFLLDFIFYKNNKLNKKDYIHKVYKYYGKSQTLLNALINNNLLQKYDKFEKIDVYNYVKDNFYNEINNYKLYNKEDSDLKESNIDNQIMIIQKKELKYCNCLINKNKGNIPIDQASISKLDKNSKFKYLEKEFKKMENENGHIFPITLFENMLKEINVNQSLIDIVGNYLRKKTQKNFLNYDIFEQLLSFFNIGCNNITEYDHNKLIDNLFELFSYPNNYITKTAFFIFIKSTRGDLSSSVIHQIFDEHKIEKYIYKDKFKDIIKYLINDLLESFEHIKYIPYIFFKQDLENKKLEKNCVDILLKGKDIKDYILERIEYDVKFYVIDYQFWYNWNILINDEHTNNTKLKKLQINIKSICNDGFRIKEGLVYLKDYIILSPRLYSLFSKWYKFSDDEEIERERISLFDDEDLIKNIKNVDMKKEFSDIEINSEALTMPTSPKYKEREKDSNNDDYFRSKNYEIEVFPVFLVFYKMEDLISKGLNTLSNLEDHMRKLVKAKTNFKYNKFSKKTKISSIIEQLQEYFENKLTPKTARFWVYYNDKIEIIPYEDTLEKHGITNVAFTIIELNQNGLWQTEKLDIKKNLLKRNNETPLVGLVNVGNSCYMNSVLQIFLNIPQIKNIFIDEKNGVEVGDIQKINPEFLNFIENKTKKNYLLNSFLSLLVEKWLGSKKTLNPQLFKEICGSYNETFKEYEQQDAYDFYTFLLDILHEETNIKLNHQIKNCEITDISEEDLGNIYWSNTVRNNASFFYALFMGQLQSKLICSKCKKEKIKYEPFNALNLPIPEEDKIIIKICLFRLPITLSPFYENTQYQKESNSLRNKIINSSKLNQVRKKLIKIKKIQITPQIKYSNTNNICNRNKKNNEIGVQLTESNSEIDNINLNTQYFELAKKEKDILRTENGEEIISNALIFNIPLMLKIEIDRNKKCQDIIEVLKNMKELYLDVGNVFTEFIIFNEEFNIINNQIINNCIFPLKEIYIYELLNYEGIKKVFGYDDLGNNDDIVIKLNNQNNSPNINIEDLKNEEEKNKINTIQTLSVNKDNYESIQNNQDKNINIFQNKNYISENLIEIKHRYRKDTKYKQKYSFVQSFDEMSTLKDFIILTNKNSIKPYHLYEMLWEKYMYFLDNPYNKYIWWKQKTNNEGNSDTINKKCSPFMIKIVQKLNYGCAFCPWFKFCTGCVISPENNNYININPNWVIIVEWCKEIVENEINVNNLLLKLYHSSFKKEFIKEENKYDKLSIYNCLELFTQKEILKDILCEKCNIKTTFTKELKIERLPEYLFIVFKRFKYISKYSTKLENLISFPFEDLQLGNYLMQKNKKHKKYDLYAIINHNGSMSRGHYYCNVKQDNKWIRYEDSYVIEDNDINISNVYLLVYAANNKDYYKNKKYYFHFNFLGLMNTAYKIYLTQYNFEHLFNYILNENEEIIEEFKNNCQYYYGEPVTINGHLGYLVNVYKNNNEIFTKIKISNGFINTKIENSKIKDTIKEEKDLNNEILSNNQNKAICSGCIIY